MSEESYCILQSFYLYTLRLFILLLFVSFVPLIFLLAMYALLGYDSFTRSILSFNLKSIKLSFCCCFTSLELNFTKDIILLSVSFLLIMPTLVFIELIYIISENDI